MHRTVIAAVLLATGHAAAAPITLTIDPGQSSIDIESTLSTVVGDDSDSASSPISGIIEIDLDRFVSPTSISVIDFVFVLENNIVLAYDFGLAGAASATLDTAAALYGLEGEPTGPVLVAGGMFDFPAVPSSLAGTLDASYELLIVGSNAVSIDLADLGLFESPISGLVTGNGTTVTLNASYAFEAMQELVPEIASLQLAGTATIVANGKNPSVTGCNDADLVRPFGVIDLADVNAFTTAFRALDPIADLAEEFGVFDLNDVQAFINAFNEGCP